MSRSLPFPGAFRIGEHDVVEILIQLGAIQAVSACCRWIWRTTWTRLHSAISCAIQYRHQLSQSYWPGRGCLEPMEIGFAEEMRGLNDSVICSRSGRLRMAANSRFSGFHKGPREVSESYTAMSWPHLPLSRCHWLSQGLFLAFADTNLRWFINDRGILQRGPSPLIRHWIPPHYRQPARYSKPPTSVTITGFALRSAPETFDFKAFLSARWDITSWIRSTAMSGISLASGSSSDPCLQMTRFGVFCLA